MRRFYAPPEQFVDDETVTLSAEETRHLRDVLRLHEGDEAHLFDGEGHEFLCKITKVGKASAELQMLREIEPAAPESDLEVTLAAAVYKNDKFDLVVQKAVELGVARISPIVTMRSEVKLRDTLKRTERWQKIALEATKQCERAKIMIVDEPMPFQDLVARADPKSRLLLMFSEKDGKGVPEKAAQKKITALVGPKGGWDDPEIQMAEECGFIPIKLGRRIMRAETAAITFAALLQHRFGDLN